ncbi:MAG: hypothetical protein ACK5LJ_01485, partial [Paracoccus sp. (in: a-proteobacteria)]
GRSEIAGFSTEPYETLQFKATKTDPLSQKISMLSVVQSQLGSGVDGNTNGAADRTHGHSLNQHVEDHDALMEGQFVHATNVGYM